MRKREGENENEGGGIIYSFQELSIRVLCICLHQKSIMEDMRDPVYITHGHC